MDFNVVRKRLKAIASKEVIADMLANIPQFGDDYIPVPLELSRAVKRIFRPHRGYSTAYERKNGDIFAVIVLNKSYQDEYKMRLKLT